MPRARLPQLQSITDGSFEPARKNPISLAEDSFLDEHQKPIRIGESASPLSLSKNQIRIDGDFHLEGKLANPLLTTDFEYLELRAEENIRFTASSGSGSLDLYVFGGDSFFTTSGDDFYFIGQNSGLFQFGDLDQGITQFQFDSINSKFLIANAEDTGDNFAIQVDDNAETTIATLDDTGTAGHITIDADGDITLDAASGNIYAKDNGGNYTPGSDYEIATKKYVDDNAGGATGDSGNAAIYDNSGTPAFKSGITKAEVLSLLNVADGATAGGASALNDLSDVSYSSGDLSINLLDTIVAPATLTIDAGGDIVLDADGGDVFIKDNGSTLIQLANNTIVVGEAQYGNSSITYDGDDLLEFATNELNIFNYLKIAETASANSDTAARGQIWVKNDTPNCLAFTDDAGTDIIGIGKYQYEQQRIGYAVFGTTCFIPMTGGTFELTATTSANEFVSFIAPYDGRVEKFCFRSEIAQNGSLTLRLVESQDGTETPGTQVFRKDHTINIADDTFLDLDMTSPGIGSDFAPMTKGRLYAFQIVTPTASQDTNVVVVFRWDITT